MHSIENKMKFDDYTYPKGIGGWLAFLIFFLVLFGFSGFAELSDLKNTVTHQYSDFAIRKWKTYVEFMTWSQYADFALRLFAGYYLVAKKNWSSVVLTICIIWLIGPISLVLEAIVSDAIFYPLQVTQFEQTFGSSIGSSIGAALWSAYLLRSKRVRNTYPR
jgi:hypothetical protein